MAAGHPPGTDPAPSRTLTFLFTDIEGSTRVWEQDGPAMRDALASHDALLADVVTETGGRVVKTTGDGMLAVFEDPAAAIDAAIGAQRRLDEVAWATAEPLRVRMGVHCGPATERDGDYYGSTLNRTARIMALGHGGQVLVSEAVVLLLRDGPPSGIGLRDLGEHRLRDLTHVERVHQAEADGLPAKFPPLRSPDVYVTNLPAQLTSFVGREQEIEDLTALVRRERMVTLTGVGGVGKTRLAVRVAAELLPDARDGIWLCELASAESDEAVGEVIASTLSIVPGAGVSLREAIVTALRDRECIVVLDNCEHVLDAAAELAEAVLRGCPGTRILATSREGLGLAGEHLRPIPSLRLPEQESVTAALGSDATTLFAERAVAIAPAFQLDDTNAAAVVEICRRLDGIPLAIELAAARITSLQPSEIVTLLDERFRLLTGSRRRSVERHQTLRAAVDWSYSLLSELERTVFDRLGVFSGSFDAAAAYAVAPSVDRFGGLDALGELVAKSMVGTEAASDGTTRYRLLETLRQYALERLEAAGNADDARALHAEHFAALTLDLGGRLYGPEEVTARARLLRDLDNARAALDWAIDSADVRLTTSLVAPIAGEAGWNRGTGVGAWANRAIELEPVDPPPEWWWVMTAAGFFHLNDTGDTERALVIAEAVIRQPDTPNDARMWACVLRSFAQMTLGDFTSAVEQLVADYAEHEDEHGANLVGAVACLAIFYGFSDPERAIAYADDSLRRAVVLGAPSAIALAYFARGAALIAHDDQAARRDLEAALEYADQGAGDVVADRPLQMLAILVWRDGDTMTAARMLARALRRSFAAGDYSACATTIPIVLPILRGHLRDQPLLMLAGAVDAGTLPAVMKNPLFADVDQGAHDAVVVAEQTLGVEAGAAARTAGAALRRDEVIRLTLAELDAIAAPG